MLNISDKVVRFKKLEEFESFKKIQTLNWPRKLSFWILGFVILIIVIMLLPWTQTIRAKGKISTLRPEYRPQSIYPVIPGAIESWYVREGDTVRTGDTLLKLTEIKTEYFDPNLIERTKEQVLAKEFSVKSYEQKAEALEIQISALQEALKLKLEQTDNKIKQAKLKIQSDSIDMQASKIANDIAKFQFLRADTMYRAGVISLTKWEEKRNKMQETIAKLNAQENKFLISKNELMNALIELNSIRQDYTDKVSKARSDRFSAMSSIYDAEGSVSKLKNQQTNYESRNQFYYITAPQDGIVSKIYKKGLGEIVKDGEEIMSIMPSNALLAVEMYVRPMDYPLLRVGLPVIFTFDGWPAFVFSGWPDGSVGTFSGHIYALDNVTDENNLFRVFIEPDTNYIHKNWPKGLRVGTGADGRIILNDVPLWYEVWRQLNGFPPDYYDESKAHGPKMKAAIKSLAK
jgi:multidrug resistance efflux pump